MMTMTTATNSHPTRVYLLGADTAAAQAIAARLSERWELQTLDSPRALLRRLNAARVSIVVADRLSSLGDSPQVLERAIRMLRESDVRLYLLEEGDEAVDLRWAYRTVEAMQEARGHAVRRGLQRSPCRTGRPPVEFDELEARRLRREGQSWRAIGDALGVNEGTVRRRLRVAESIG